MGCKLNITSKGLGWSAPGRLVKNIKKTFRKFARQVFNICPLYVKSPAAVLSRTYFSPVSKNYFSCSPLFRVTNGQRFLLKATWWVIITVLASILRNILLVFTIKFYLHFVQVGKTCKHKSTCTSYLLSQFFSLDAI